MTTYNFSLQPKLNEISTMRKKIESIFNDENIFDDITRKNIILTATELFVNVVKHGGLSPDMYVRFQIEKKATCFELTMYDEGNTYDPSNVKLPDISNFPENGFGLYLVKTLMDKFEYYPKNSTSNYNVTRIIKNFN